MTWTAPTPDPPTDEPLVGPERPILEATLVWHRYTLLRKCAGLNGVQLAERSVPPSRLSLLGLVRHMAKVERAWFRLRAAGQDIEAMYAAESDKDADFEQLDPEQADTDVARYLAECRQADDAVAGLDLDSTFVHRGEPHSLRLVYVHMIEEYARHNGHADLLRERIDGSTGE